MSSVYGCTTKNRANPKKFSVNVKMRAFEWIPYNQFNDIRETIKSDSTTIYSGIWVDGPLYYNNHELKYKRISNFKVALKCNDNSKNITDEFLNEAKSYSIEKFKFDNLKIYGISQNPDTKDYILVLQNGYCINCGKIYMNQDDKWCKLCQMNSLKQNFTNWTSRNEKIDELIQEMQLKIESYRDIIVEWIPYNKFSDINEIIKDDFTTVYSAIWMDGPLYYYDYNKLEYKRKLNEKVVLKCLNNSKNAIGRFINEVKSYPINSIYFDDIKIYGISQNPETKDYIIVLEDDHCRICGEKYTDNNWCKPCQINNFKEANWTSENKKIDEFIQEMQLKINTSYDEIFEWIPYNQFDDIKEVSKNDSATLHSAIWINGPLEYNYEKEENKRVSNKVVALKCLNNSQNGVNEFMNEIKSYSNNKKIYGVSQNPDTKDYIMVLKNDYCKICGKMFRDDNWCKLCQMNNIRQNFVNWTSENEKIDDFIQEMQMRINDFNDIIVEWIPYNQFNDIKEIGKGGFSKVYSAIWMDGPLKYDTYSRKYKRIPNKEVALKILNNSQNISKEFLNEAKNYSIKFYSDIIQIYGISQNQNTKDYIMVLQYVKGGDFYNYINNYIINWSWFERLDALLKIISGLKTIHENNIVHRDFHTGNILASFNNNGFHYAMSGNFLCNVYISDMGLCEEANNVDKTKIYGVMPFVAPEVLRGKPYTQAADIYSFGMIMYFVATRRQPFANCAHDNILALNICNRFRPEINEQEAPKCYVDLMTRCWDSNPDNRPNAIEIEELIELFNENDNEEIKNQFENVVKYRMANLPPIDNNQSTIHPQACYTSRLLNPFTKGLTECLDCVIND
ncbi:hypothetical protein RclHR1_07090008 [Rhizophagus clarus]|uniref:Protein kinase domain-containing protein n=1 Tax=Rhizophagus clarus TaxID=94130 RepID=A0A2Z6SKL3_9GLOM|nr:hypothetical protein RclHR1_07090008 [Rhizophagus clarus]